MSSVSAASIPKPDDGIDFSSLPWNLNLPDQHNYIHITTKTAGWDREEQLANLEKSLHKFSNRSLPLTPAAKCLNYGTMVWEGMKAYRLTDDDAVIFRADRNYERMKNGAAELTLPMPDKELFMRAVQLAIQKNAHLLPPPGNGRMLYVRPMLFGSGDQLGLHPCTEYSFVVYVSPTRNYFVNATTGLNLHLETRRCRASPGGMGSVKCPGNYAAVVKPLMDCKKHHFHDNLFLELTEKMWSSELRSTETLENSILQEMSAANVFLVLKTGEIVTPSLSRKSVLPGITRDSVLQLIEEYAEEIKSAMIESTGSEDVVVRASTRDVAVKELRDASEAFCTGTAAELVPIHRVATSPDDGDDINFDVALPYGADYPGGPVTTLLLSMLQEAMVGKRSIATDRGWLRNPFDTPENFAE